MDVKIAVVTPTQKEAEKRTKVLTELHGLLNSVQENIKVPIEVYEKPNEKEMPVDKYQSSPPNKDNNQSGGGQSPDDNKYRKRGQVKKMKYKDLPDVIVCYKEPLEPGGQEEIDQQAQNHYQQYYQEKNYQQQNYEQNYQHYHKKSRGRSRENKLRPCKSRELRAGNLFVGCDCEKRNGLQDSCPRTDCQGQPQCLTYPNPTCPPSQFCNGKHLEKKKAAFLARLEIIKQMKKPPCDEGCPAMQSRRTDECDPKCPIHQNKSVAKMDHKCDHPGCTETRPHHHHHHHIHVKSGKTKKKAKYTCYPAKVKPPVVPVCLKTCIYADPDEDSPLKVSSNDQSLLNYEKALQMCKCIVEN